ncbi:MAG: DUF1552 domain-containing protein, partial [Planctomycetales bacterium]
RGFLQAAGCTLALPALESFGEDSGAGESAKAKRMLLFCLGQGFYTPGMYAATEGAGYETPPILKPLERHRDDFTVLGGLQNSPDASINHHGGQRYVFSGYSKGTGRLKDSLDQFAAKKIGDKTRVAVTTTGGASFKDGLPVSGQRTPRAMFDFLFGKIDKQKEAQAIAYRKSILDYVVDDAKRLDKRVTAADRAKLEEYYESVREAEASLRKKEDWLGKDQIDAPYPTVKEPALPEGADPRKYLQTLSDEEKRMWGARREPSSLALQEQLRIIELAFKHDLTRVACIYLGSPNYGYHGITHNVRSGGAGGLSGWAAFYMDAFATVFDNLKAAKTPGGGNLMDETITILSTTLGINEMIGSHSSRDIPMVIAGGGLDHGKYRYLKSQVSPCNVYVTALQQMGIQVDKFANSTGRFDV